MNALTAVHYDYMQERVYEIMIRPLSVEILRALIDCTCAAPLNSGDKRNEDSLGKHARSSCAYV